MNKTLVATINNANIYLVNDDKIPFYICIPTTEINSASMLINILNNPNEINPSLNNIEQVKNKLNAE